MSVIRMVYEVHVTWDFLRTHVQYHVVVVYLLPASSSRLVPALTTVLRTSAPLLSLYGAIHIR
jgi:hypothetical protein